jgi:hypothetical protein
MRCAVNRESTFDERSAGNRHATFCGSWGWIVAPGDPVGGWHSHVSIVPTATR